MRFCRMCISITMVLLVGLPHEVSADCTGPVGSEARMIYNYDCHVLQYCDGTDWVLVGRKNPACDDTTSDPFAFTDQIGVALSTLTNSNIVQISGIHAAATVSISGGGSPKYRTCTNGASGANCDSSVVQNWTSSPGTIQNNQYLQLRLTSSASNATALSANIDVGGVSDNWSVTTIGGCGVSVTGLRHTTNNKRYGERR